MKAKIKKWVVRKIEEQSRLEKFLVWLLDLPYFIRVQKVVSAVAGPKYARSRNLIQLDINYACNLKCFSCNRSCGFAPSEDHLTLEQIRRFMQESRDRNIQWERIHILGGEPTLHPDFLEILDELLAFKQAYCQNAVIEVFTNGFGPKVNRVIAKIRDGAVVHNTAKQSRVQQFSPFNLAPRDSLSYKFADFSCGCEVIKTCGIGLSPYGYYPCAVAAAIDRVLGLDIGRKSLPDPSDSMRDQMAVLCSYCGHFMTIRGSLIDAELISDSWREAYHNYQVSKPCMTFY